MKLWVVKKHTLLVSLCIVCLTAGVFCAAFMMQAKSASAEIYRGQPTVVIDAGHGGRDAGVTGKITKIKESDINLAIAKKLEAYLRCAKINVVQTRKNKDGLYGPFDKNRKMADMKARKEIIKKTDPALVVSIHQNSFVQSGERGFQVFYKNGNDEGKILAQFLQTEAIKKLPHAREKIKTGNYYILECTEKPSVIAECGFLTNPEEEKQLATSDYQEKVAYSLFCGILKYLHIGKT